MSSGAVLVAKSLKKLGVTAVFGIVGIPIVEIADALIEEGIRFISFRNEQAASYAASAYGFLTGKPGVLLVVGGPGVVHATAGILNSNSNRWPLLVIAGSAGIDDVGKGAFQELDHISLLSPHTKVAARPLVLDQIPSLLFKAYKTSFFGVPGASFIDIPAHLIESSLESNRVSHESLSGTTLLNPEDNPKFQPSPSRIETIVPLIRNSRNPLVIIGKGATYSDSSSLIRVFIKKHNLPFLPTPMGKGVVPDSSLLNVSSARSLALRTADVVILLGARLNWILHYGEEPRYQSGVKFIQVDQSPEEIGNNSPSSLTYGLVGDIGLTINELEKALGDYRAPDLAQSIKNKIITNNESLLAKELASPLQLTYNNVYRIIREKIEPISQDVILVTEGANTMDVARVSFPQDFPKQRLDAGTNATMGVGLGYSIAAKLANPEKTVLAIEGDSAFGFSGMEIETAVRSHLPLIIIVMNNSGIYHGIDTKVYSYEDYEKLPSTALSKDTRYDILAKSLGAEGFYVRNEQELSSSFSTALQNLQKGRVTLLNVIIAPATKKKIGFGWQNKKPSKL